MRSRKRCAFAGTDGWDSSPSTSFRVNRVSGDLAITRKMAWRVLSGLSGDDDNLTDTNKIRPIVFKSVEAP